MHQTIDRPPTPPQTPLGNIMPGPDMQKSDVVDASLQSLASKNQVLDSPSIEKSTSITHASLPKTHPPVILLGTGLRPISPNRSVFNAKDYFMPMPISQPRLTSPRAKPIDKRITSIDSLDSSADSDDFDLDTAVRQAGDRVASMYGHEDLAKDPSEITPSDFETASSIPIHDVKQLQTSPSPDSVLLTPASVPHTPTAVAKAAPSIPAKVQDSDEIPIDHAETPLQVINHDDPQSIEEDTSKAKDALQVTPTETNNVKNAPPVEASPELFSTPAPSHAPSSPSEILQEQKAATDHEDINQDTDSKQTLEPQSINGIISKSTVHDDQISIIPAEEPVESSTSDPQTDTTPWIPSSCGPSEDINSPSQEVHSEPFGESAPTTATLPDSTDHDNANAIIPKAKEIVALTPSDSRTDTTPSIPPSSYPLEEIIPSHEVHSESVREPAATTVILSDFVDPDVPLDHQKLDPSTAEELVVASLSTDNQHATIPSIYSSIVHTVDADNLSHKSPSEEVPEPAASTATLSDSTVVDRAVNLQSTSPLEAKGAIEPSSINKEPITTPSIQSSGISLEKSELLPVVSKVHDIENNGSDSSNISTAIRSSSAEGELIDSYHQDAPEQLLSASAVPMSRSSSVAEAEILNAYAASKDADLKPVDDPDALSEQRADGKQEASLPESVNSKDAELKSLDHLDALSEQQADTKQEPSPAEDMNFKDAGMKPVDYLDALSQHHAECKQEPARAKDMNDEAAEHNPVDHLEELALSEQHADVKQEPSLPEDVNSEEAELNHIVPLDTLSQQHADVKQEASHPEVGSPDIIEGTAADHLSDANAMSEQQEQATDAIKNESELPSIEDQDHLAIIDTKQPPTVENDTPLAVPTSIRRSIDSDLSEKQTSSDAGDDLSLASSSNVLSSLSTPSLSQSLNSTVSATSPSEISDAVMTPTVTTFTSDSLAKDMQKDLATDAALDPVVEIPAAEMETIHRETTPTAVLVTTPAAVVDVATPALALSAQSNTLNALSRSPTPPPKPTALKSASPSISTPPVRPTSWTPPADSHRAIVSAERPVRSARPVTHTKRAQTMGLSSFPEAGPSAGPSGSSGPGFSASHSRSYHMRPPVANRFHSAPARHSLVPSLDDVDKLDITGLYGPSGLLHHDGPYDACLTYRNQRPRQAPVLAFAEEEELAAQEQERRYSRTKSIHHTNVWGANPEEAFEDYAAAARRRRQSRYAASAGSGSAESSRASSRQPSPEPSPSSSPKLLPVPNKPGKPSPLSQSTTAAAREEGRSLRSRGSERKSSMKRSKSILERFRSMRDKPSVPFNEHHEEATGAPNLSKKSTIRKLGQTLGLSRRGRQTTVV